MSRELSKKLIKIIIVLLIVVGIGYGGYYGYNKMKSSKTAIAANAQKETTFDVTRGNLSVNIEGTGTVEPISRYDIIPMVRGTILSAPFEEGMTVKKDDLLFQFDDSDAAINIEKTKNSIEKLILDNQSTKNALDNMIVYSPYDGRIINFTNKVGDYINSSTKIADIVDDSRFIVKLPFSPEQMDLIQIGQDVNLLPLDDSDILGGTVRDKSDSNIATIEIKNPNSFDYGIEVIGMIKTSVGEVSSSDSAVIQYNKEQTLRLEDAMGVVKNIYISNNEHVKAGQKIFELEDSDLITEQTKFELSLKDSQLSLQSQMKELDDYSILSPIDGIVITKNYKVGDSINSSSSESILMTVADMSKMIFDMQVDELDIAKIKVGQKVNITAEALEDQQFEGEVTNIAAEGTPSNGVTTYTVQITISDPGGLKPGMNVNAEIFVEQKENVLYVPMSAVQKVRNETFVYVKKEAGIQDKNNINKNNINKENQQGSQNDKPTNNAANTSSANSANPQAQQQGTPNVLSDRERRIITVGINNEDYIEVTSGLQEGEKVIIPSTSARSSTNTTMGGFSGGMGVMGGRPPR
ncbi:HlyD family efflux transporter periplasmic adaptor subunit [Petroclostridium sp. X23]|uniref:efflux RND transporter periplasmic adaptor subunit n=1 Tax=Petroclostridium sp. X23 TaxID=3045146 RepID=UPI0024AE4569|nr:HlyD family efflux transporter periplasmic adaptor subunit [Petroclostridium sp. X23]WHH57392.1 efflux RND transporter periplasmic adaptor subunit [Petroclostridium sp. X23]